MLALLVAALIADRRLDDGGGRQRNPPKKDLSNALFAYQDATREDPSSAVLW